MSNALIIYSLFFIGLIVLSCINKQKTSFFLGVSLFVLLFVCAEVGADYVSYKNIYQQSGIGNFEVGRIEKLYLYINYFFYKLGFSYKLFRVCLLSLCLLVISSVIYKTSSNFAFSFLILYGFYIIYLVSAYRQLITMAIFIFSIWLLVYKKKKCLPLILNFTAIFIHNLAIIQFLVFCFIYIYESLSKKEIKIKFSLKTTIFLILGCLVIRFLLYFTLRVEKVKSLLSFIPSYYLNEVSFINEGLLSRLCEFLIIVLLYNYAQENENNNKLLTIYILAMLLYFSVPYELIMGRLINNIRLLEIIIIPNLFFFTKNSSISNINSIYQRKNKVLLLLLLIFLIVVVFVNQIMSQSDYFPLKNYFIGGI